MAPQPTESAKLELTPKTSFFNVPITLSYKELAKQTNQLLSKEIYKDSIIEDDNMTMILEKKGAISFEYQDGKLRTLLPVKAQIKYRYGTSVFGKGLYDTKTIELDGIVNLLSHINLTNWTINTQTSLQDIEWLSSPTISMLGKPVKATYLVNPAIKLFRKKIEKSIDDALTKNMNFKPQVIDAISQLTEPSLMHDDYEAWLQVLPIEIYSTKAVLTPNDIKVQMGLKCLLETTLGKKPNKTWDKNTLVLKPVEKMPNYFKANVIAFADYKDASRIMTKNYKGYTITEGKRSIEVTKVELWQQKDKMVIALDLIGSIKGTIYLKGVPRYDADKQTIYFEDLNYALETKNVLIKTGNWLLKGTVLKKLQQQAFYSIEPNMKEAEKNIKKYLNGHQPAKGVIVNGKLNTLEFEKFYLTNQGIVVFLNGTGQLDVTIDGM